MFASLPMYDFPELRDQTDQFWQVIRGYLGERSIGSPQRLRRDNDLLKQWANPNLMLSQTCGCPYRRYLHEKVYLVGTPDLGIDCTSGYYYSCLLTKVGTSLNSDCWQSLAYNDDHSQSGWVAPIIYAQNRRIRINNYVQTGSHWQSAIEVSSGRAEVAAVDVSTWHIIQQLAPFASELVVAAKTDETPGLPFITAKSELADHLFEAVNFTVQALTPEQKSILPFRPLVKIEDSVYQEVEDILK